MVRAVRVLAVTATLAGLLDGRPVDAIGGEGVVVDPPLRARDLETSLPPVLVERRAGGEPAAGARLGELFEARFVFQGRSTERWLQNRIREAAAQALVVG